ncbi:hypothetical protein [Micromonospora chersina]|uniref:hypothetical protein n=1 Tax=Micromonospora chersina TaxID=47854 RepID=UPI00142F2875|nr:hypothetical protein [Micromonospora chersina]
MADIIRAWRSTALARNSGAIETELDVAWACLLSEWDVAVGSRSELQLVGRRAAE